MWMGSSISTADEWIELKNLSSKDIDFSKTPWSIYKNDTLMIVINKKISKAGDFFLISNNAKDYKFSKGESVLDIEPDFIDTAVSLSNSAAQYKLYDFPNNTGTLIDTADDGTGDPLVGENEIVKKSMERNSTFGDGTKKENWHTCLQSINLDGSASDCGTPKAENSTPPPPPPPPPPKVYSDKIYINDLLPNPSGEEGEKEFVEIFNNSTDEIDLEGWILKDRTTSQYTFSKGQKIAPNDYLVIYSSDYPFALNNSGSEEVSLSNPDGKPISSVAYSGTAKEDYSYSFNGSNWKWTSLLTPGKANEFLDFSGDIKITALSPNPAGNDVKKEWLTIKNGTKKEINLKGWSIATGWKKMYNHPIREDFKIKPGKSKKLTRKICAFTLNNTKSKIELRDPLGETVQEIKYNRKKDKIKDDEVYQIKGKKWNWNKSASPASVENTITTETTAPASPPNVIIPIPTISEEELKLKEEEKEIEENVNKFTPEPEEDEEENSNEEFSKIKAPKNLALNNSIPRFSHEIGQVLGVSDIRETNAQYFFTPPIEQKHWAVGSAENIWEIANQKINSLISWLQ